MTVATALELFVAVSVSSVLLAAIVWSVWWLDRYDREPLVLMAAAFGWGAVAAPVTCILLGPAVHAAFPTVIPMETTLAVAAPLLEELAKSIGIVLIAWRSREFDNATDGIVYGAATGLGFAATENAAYCLAGAATDVDLLSLVVQRVVASAGLHALASSAFGGFVGAASLMRAGLRRASWVVVGFAVAAAMHVGWNALVMTVWRHDQSAVWWMIIPGAVVCWLALLALFLESERRIIREQLQHEVELGVLPSWVVDVMPSYRRRIRADWWPDRRERAVISRLLTRLAFRKHAVARLPGDQSRLAGLEVVWLRDRARKILSASPDEP
jgi:RsiW-degrading membrane proteinase PrsW (M82 family)